MNRKKEVETEKVTLSNFKIQNSNGSFLDNNYFRCFLVLILIVIIFILYADWIGDNDIWWHMKYGELMLENLTLRPDHSVFSWTPADKDWIYVTWFPDIVLYVVYAFGGLPMLFLFRYFLIISLCTIILFYALRICNQKSFYLALLIVVIIISQARGTFIHIKPELFSLLFFVCCLVLYFYAKERNYRYFFVYPIIFVIWVNSHGVFIFGFLLVGLLLGGEIINYIFKTKDKLSTESLKTFLFALGFSILAILLNPYGINYPLYLYELLTSPKFKDYAGYIQATKSILEMLEQFASFYTFNRMHYLDLSLIFLAVTAVLFFAMVIWVFIKKRKLNMPLILINISFLLLFFQAVRTTFFYWIVCGISFIALYKDLDISDKKRKIISIACIIVFLVEVGLLIRQYHYGDRIWFWNAENVRAAYVPDRAIAFMKRNDLMGYPLFTEYHAGSYMLWALYPQGKVFIDGRGSVYIKTGVFEDYKEVFLKGYDRLIGEDRVQTYSIERVIEKKPLFQRLYEKYGFKVAIISMGTDTVIFPFMFSEDWRMVYFDVNSIIFVHKSIDSSNIQTDFSPQRFQKIKNLSVLLTIFSFYLNIQDVNSALYIYEIIKNNHQGNPIVEYCEKMLKLVSASKLF